MKHRFAAVIGTAITVGLAAVGAGVGQAAAANSSIPYVWQNCTHLHKHYRHGVGRHGAHDHTSGVPVTNFFVSTRLYNIAMHYNHRLDADRDGIACEAH